MSVTVEIAETGKAPWRYTVKDFDELTLADWRGLTVPKIEEGTTGDQLEVTYEMLRRHTGIPKTKLRMLPPGEADKLINAIGETLKLAMEVSGKDDKLYVPPDTLSIAGRTFTVPKDLERDTIHGQWMDLSIADKFEDEADVIVWFLAVLLIEHGKEYAGAQTEDHKKLFMGLKMIDVFPLASFFFASSERFSSAVSLAFDRYRTSKQHSARRGLKDLLETMGLTSKPSAPPS